MNHPHSHFKMDAESNPNCQYRRTPSYRIWYGFLFHGGDCEPYRSRLNQLACSNIAHVSISIQTAISSAKGIFALPPRGCSTGISSSDSGVEARGTGPSGLIVGADDSRRGGRSGEWQSEEVQGGSRRFKEGCRS